jgi:5-methylcytosine-specific restriction protein B
MMSDGAEGWVNDDNQGSPTNGLFAPRIGDVLVRRISALHEQLAANGELLPREQAEGCYRRFRELFGPEALAGLDGEALLQKMHGRGTKESLAYWLEFKDDEEFPARFGSISGGSALKFGFYQASDTGLWMSGTTRQQTRLTTAEAVTMARTQRDQLLAGARVLASVGGDPETVDYAALQRALVEAAPDVAESSWGHKYFALLFAHLLEPFHGVDYQAHQLRKLLKLPSPGRYQNARIFVGVARQLGLSLLDLAATLHRLNGSPHGYWRVGTTVDGESEWERMRLGGFAAIGWEAVGDLTELPATPFGRESLREIVERSYPGDAASVTKAANQLFYFATRAHVGDIVLGMQGQTVRGIGRIAGGYAFKAGDGPFPHRRNVEWRDFDAWKLPKPEAFRTAFVAVKRDLNIIAIEGQLLEAPTVAVQATADVREAPTPLAPLIGIMSRIDAVLQRKRQVILHGPPGTGKTHWAERAAEELAARAWFAVGARELTPGQRADLAASGAIELCSFHPAYGYEDFLEGFRPVSRTGALQFELRDGIFKRLCARAVNVPHKPHFLIIDEINRGDIPRIFGELLTVLEKDKRGRAITLPLSATRFSVPDNVFVIGTMNTADRSIALLDAALRRRFGFIEVLPDSTVLSGVAVGGLPLGPWLDELNRRIIQSVGRDGRHLQVGHSYLMTAGGAVRDQTRFVEILRDEIVPLVEEYCYEDFNALERILGSVLVQKQRQRIDASLFEPARHGDLLQGLISAFASVTATTQAVAAQDEEATEEALDDPGEDAPSP